MYNAATDRGVEGQQLSLCYFEDLFYFYHSISLMVHICQGWKETRISGKKVFKVFLVFSYTKTGHKIMTQKFVKNISYMRHLSPATSFIATCRL